MMRRLFWYLMLALSVALFVAMLISNNLFLLLAGLACAFIVRIKGNRVLFGDYDRKRKEKIARIRQLRAKKSEV